MMDYAKEYDRMVEQSNEQQETIDSLVKSLTDYLQCSSVMTPDASHERVKAFDLLYKITGKKLWKE